MTGLPHGTFALFVLLILSARGQDLGSLVAPDAKPRRIVSGLISTEGPVCDSTGALYYCDFVALQDNGPNYKGKVFKLDQTAPIFTAGTPSGLAFDGYGRLIVSGYKTVWRLQNGSLTVIAQGDSLRQANDLSFSSSGGLFFTSDLWDSEGGVFYLSADGALRKILSFPARQFPNGIQFWEEKGLLLVGLSQAGKIMKYAVDRQMNVETAGTLFASVNGPDGIKIDEKGNVWVATSDRAIAVFDSIGKSIGTIPVDDGTTNLCFGGNDGTMLYITGGGCVYSLQTLVKGRKVSFATPVVNALGRRSYTAIEARKQLAAIHTRSGATRCMVGSGRKTVGLDGSRR